jgi:hypothetical protein
VTRSPGVRGAGSALARVPAGTVFSASASALPSGHRRDRRRSPGSNRLQFSFAPNYGITLIPPPAIPLYAGDAIRIRVAGDAARADRRGSDFRISDDGGVPEASNTCGGIASANRISPCAAWPDSREPPATPVDRGGESP